jgi:hypothetical protein|tara:strand:- start:323 stop:955 length:633 start_codon:yes stop_codon:yes gene_type:complete
MDYLNFKNISTYSSNIAKSGNYKMIKQNQTYITIFITLLLIKLIGLGFVLNSYLLIYYVVLNINNITNKNTDSNLLTIYGCCYMSELFLGNYIQYHIRFEFLICKLIFYVWMVHPLSNGYEQIYNIINSFFCITTKKQKINNNILNALEILEKRQINQSEKLTKVFEFYEKLNTDLDKYEINEKQIFPVESQENSNESSLYIHPPKDKNE